MYEAELKWQRRKGLLDNLIVTDQIASKSPDNVAVFFQDRILARFKEIPESRWEDVTPPIRRWSHGNAWKEKIRAYQIH
ncbi:MAG: hypothetical protein ACU843_16120 [Gammaproteobacteria bacterium]